MASLFFFSRDPLSYLLLFLDPYSLSQSLLTFRPVQEIIKKNEWKQEYCKEHATIMRVIIDEELRGFGYNKHRNASYHSPFTKFWLASYLHFCKLPDTISEFLLFRYFITSGDEEALSLYLCQRDVRFAGISYDTAILMALHEGQRTPAGGNILRILVQKLPNVHAPLVVQPQDMIKVCNANRYHILMVMLEYPETFLIPQWQISDMVINIGSAAAYEVLLRIIDKINH